MKDVRIFRNSEYIEKTLMKFEVAILQPGQVLRF